MERLTTLAAGDKVLLKRGSYSVQEITAAAFKMAKAPSLLTAEGTTGNYAAAYTNLTGMTITVTEAGTYFLTAAVRTHMPTTASYCLARAANNGTAVPNTVAISGYNLAAANTDITSNIFALITANVGDVITVQGMSATNTATYVTDSEGATRMELVRVY